MNKVSKRKGATQILAMDFTNDENSVKNSWPQERILH